MKSFEEKLAAESSAWVTEGLIGPEQRAALLARHPSGDRAGHRFIGILGLIGGGLLAAGVALLIASHWQDIGDWTKIGALVLLLIGAHLAGWRLRFSPGRYPRSGEACFMLGAALFLLGIVLVSQIFHLDRRPADGVLLWWLGIVLVPWFLRSEGTQFVSLVAFLTWLGMEITADDSWLRLMDGLQWEGHNYFAVAALLVGAALFFSGLGLRPTRWSGFAGLHEKAGLVVACVALYALAFEWSRWGSTEATQRPRALPFALLTAALLGAFAWAWRADRGEVRRIAIWFVVGLVASAGFLLGGNDCGENWLWGAGACAGLFLLNLGMIRAGLASGRESWINLGIGFVALNILTRYFVLFGTMFEGGVFFLVTGAIVLGLGLYLERKRRSLVAALRRTVA